MGFVFNSRTAICIISLLFIIILVGQGCNSPTTATNTTINTSSNQTKKYPSVYGIAVKYCEGLGYTYEYRKNESSGKWEEYCRLTAGIECDANSFFGGECHPEFSLCKREGYIPKIGVVKEGNTTRKFPICIFPDGTYCKELDFFNHNCAVEWKN